ncbi:MAG: hypothetical protein ACXV2E_03635 [Halobacteriota archaeon]
MPRGKTKTKVTLSVTNATPHVNEQVIFTINLYKQVQIHGFYKWELMSGTQTVMIYHTIGVGGFGRWDDATISLTNGVETWSRTWPSYTNKSMIFYAEYAGSVTLANSTSAGITVTLQRTQTKLTFSMATVNGCPRQPWPFNEVAVLAGDLTAQDGAGIPSQVITFTDSDGNPIMYNGQLVTAATNVNGHYATPSDCTGIWAGIDPIPAKAHFATHDQYAESWSVP